MEKQVLAAEATSHFQKEKVGNSTRTFQEAVNSLLQSGTTDSVGESGRVAQKDTDITSWEVRSAEKPTLRKLVCEVKATGLPLGVWNRGEVTDTRDFSMLVCLWEGPNREQEISHSPLRILGVSSSTLIRGWTAVCAPSCALVQSCP